MTSTKNFNPASTDLRKLHHAIVLAEEGSFARASTHLCITQSALTRSIQALEKEMDLRLFDRSHAGVTPTPAAKLVLERAQTLLMQAKNLARDVELIRGAQLGNIVMGTVPIAGGIFLPPALNQIYRQHPRLQIAVVSKNPRALLTELLEEKLEFFIGNTDLFSKRSDISIQPLAKIPIYFFVRKDHPLASYEEVLVKQMLDYSLITSFSVENFAVLARLYGTSSGVESAGRFICDELYLQREVALNSDTILVTAAHIVQQELTEGSLKLLSVRRQGGPMNLNICIVKLAGRSLSPTAELMIRMMRQIAQQRSAEG